jgi:threonine dehydrogenase-like Zn-dependent dehydrogenase
MRAAVLLEPGKVRVQRAPVPAPGGGQVRIRLEGCGVCASNLPPFEGRPWFSYPMSPGQLGHEGWGHIDAVGPGCGPHVKLGDRVAFLSDHAYAEYDVTEAQRVVPLSDMLSGKPFPGEPLGCAMNIFGRSDIHKGQTVAIVGIGFLGALLTRLCSLEGARVLAVSRRGYSLAIAKAQGAAEAIEMADHQQVIQRIGELTGGKFCDVVIEATGKQWPLDLSAEITRERGRLVVAGYHQDGPRQVNMQLWNWRGLDVINAHERDTAVYVEGIRAAAASMASGSIDPVPLYTHRYSLERLGDALAETAQRPEGFMKALIMMEKAA